MCFAALFGGDLPRADAFTMDEYIQAVLQNKTLPVQSQIEAPVVEPEPSQPADPPVQPPAAPYYPQQGMTSIDEYYKAILNKQSTPIYYQTQPLPPVPQEPATPVNPGGSEGQVKPPATPSSPSAPEGLTAAEKRLFDLINSSRINEGLSPVAVDMKLTEIARIKAQDMLENNYYGHTSPTYGSPGQMLRKFGVSFRSGGENLCKAGDVSRAHLLLLGSPEHRKIMMNPQANKVGIAVVPQQSWVLVVELFVAA